MTYDEIKKLARELRKNQTKEEAVLWDFLRNRKFIGLKFFRQHPIEYVQHGKRNFFIADFYSREVSLVIEVDGGIHKRQRSYDKQRDLLLQQKGLKVLRVENEEVNHAFNKVIDKIEARINSSLAPL